jgi:hypothetical protein
MKKIINRKIYDTETAKVVFNEWKRPPNRPGEREFEDILYLKTNGEFFLVDDELSFHPLPKELAREWLEVRSDAETYLKYFEAEE